MLLEPQPEITDEEAEGIAQEAFEAITEPTE
jgi:hypothetical protein